MYGGNSLGAEVSPPTEIEARRRTADDVPAGVIPDIELADVVQKEDLDMFRKGLRAMGASERVIAKLKGLDKLAESGGKFLATSLQITHRMHVVTVIGLYEEIDHIRQILQDDREQADPKLKMSHMDRTFYYNAYTAMVAETGKAYSLSMRGAEALVRMMLVAGGKGGSGKREKPKWGGVVKNPPIPPAPPSANGKNSE